MKYYALKEIVNNLNINCKIIKHIKRVENNTLCIEFDKKNIIYFDMSKGNSLIYKKESKTQAQKIFNAPFDTILQRRFINSRINKITLHNDDKIIRIYVNSKSSYKELNTILQFEFTGKHTNVIILDENEIILEALRHIDEFSSSRVVKVGLKLENIPKNDYIPKIELIKDLEKFLFENYSLKEQKALSSSKKQKIGVLQKSKKKLEKLISSLPLKQDLQKQSDELYEKAKFDFK